MDKETQIPLWKKILLATPGVLLSIFLILVFIITLLPIISWWGGLAALIVFVAVYLVRRNAIQQGNTPPRSYARYLRWSFASIVTGLLLHGIVRIDSAIQVDKLRKETVAEKKQAMPVQ